MSRIIKAAQLQVLLPSSDNNVHVVEGSTDPEAEHFLQNSKKIDGTILEAAKLIENAKTEAATILKDAQQQAEDINTLAKQMRMEVEAEVESLREEARTKGKTLGYQEGREKACREVEDETKGLINALEAIIVEANEKRIEILRQSEEDFLKLSLHIAEKIIKREISTDRNWLQPTIEWTLNQLAKTENITIRLNEEEYDNLKNFKSQVQAGTKSKINWESDPLLNAGDCIIETESGAIDASIEQRLKAIQEVLEENLYIGR